MFYMVSTSESRSMTRQFESFNGQRLCTWLLHRWINPLPPFVWELFFINVCQLVFVSMREPRFFNFQVGGGGGGPPGVFFLQNTQKTRKDTTINLNTIHVNVTKITTPFIQNSHLFESKQAFLNNEVYLR